MIIKRIYLKLLIPLFLIIISVLGVFFLLEKTIFYSSEYFKGKSEFYSLQNEINTFYNEKDVFGKAESKNSIIIKAFLTNEDFVSFIKELEGLGVKNNIQITIRSVASPTTEKPYFVFQIGIAGNFPNFLKFIFALENNSFSEYRLIEIQKINIKRVTTGTAEGGLPPESSIEGEIEIKVHGKP